MYPRLTIAASAALAAVSAAIRVIEPHVNQSIRLGSELTVRWEHVATDPGNVSLALVNFRHFPPVYLELENTVHTEQDQAFVQMPQELPNKGASSGYQINLIMPHNPYVIFAQSSDFNLVEHANVSHPRGSSATPAHSPSTHSKAEASTTAFIHFVQHECLEKTITTTVFSKCTEPLAPRETVCHAHSVGGSSERALDRPIRHVTVASEASTEAVGQAAKETINHAGGDSGIQSGPPRHKVTLTSTITMPVAVAAADKIPCTRCHPGERGGLEAAVVAATSEGPHLEPGYSEASALSEAPSLNAPNMTKPLYANTTRH